jgi:hypothetical protein
MQVAMTGASLPVQRKSAPVAASTPQAPQAAAQDPQEDSALMKFYKEYQTPIHVAGGALLGAGISRFAGVPGEAVLSAAGVGAFAGWIADEPRRAVCMAGGAVLGATIAHLAGLPGPAVVSAAGTGTFVGWIVG